MKLKHCALLLLALALLAQQRTVHAGPAAPGPFRFHQPDGREITLRVRGDEWFHWYEALDGRPVTVDAASGFWVYSVPGAAGPNVPSGQRVGLDVPTTPPWQPRADTTTMQTRTVMRQRSRLKSVGSHGTGLMPVLLGNFTDTTPTISVSAISNLLFATASGANSMANYYKEVSYGQFTVAAGPSGLQNWFTVSQPAAYYGATNPAYANAVDIRPAVFVREVVVAAVLAGYNFAPYDLDGDGKVDVVCVVHAGVGEDYGGGPNTIWSHRSSLSAQLGTNGPVIVQTPQGRIVIDDYIVEPEVQPKPLPAVGTDPIGIGVFCHEYGHALGLPDLYDTTYASRGVGAWSVMSYGSHNSLQRDGDCPAHFDAWCKSKLGWVEPVDYTLDYQNVPFPAAATTPFVAKLWKDGLATREYFLVENRYTNGFDAALPGPGLLIWHVDDTKGANNDNTDNKQTWYPISPGGTPSHTNSGNFHVELMQADNRWQLNVTNQSLQNVGDAGDPFPGSANNRLFGPNTAPNSYAYNVGATPGYNSFVTVSNISDPGLVMTADLYTRSPNSGPLVDWVNIAGVVPPLSGAQFSKLDDQHPVVLRAFPGVSGRALSQVQLYLNRAADGLWWDFDTQQWTTNVLSKNYDVTSAQQYGLTLAFLTGLPGGTNLVNGTHTFIVRVLNSAGIPTEIQMAMTAAHAPEVRLSLADNAVVNTLTNTFTAVATEDSGLGIERVEFALYWDGAGTEGSPPVRWYWSGTAWSTTPLWLGSDFPAHPPQATEYYPIGPDASDLLTEKQYTIAARAVDGFGDAVTNTISVFYDPGSPATIYWRYPAGGNWFDAANWTPQRVPGPTDQAVVNAPGDYTVTVNGNASVASLRFGRVVGLDRQHLVVPPGASLAMGGTDTNKIYANATLDQGGAIGAGRLRFSSGSTWNWTNDTLAGSAEITPGALLTISGSSQKRLSDGANLLNEGLISWLGGAPITVNGYNAPSEITNAPGAVFQVAADGELFNRINGSYAMIFANAGGLFTKIAGTNTVVDTCLFVNASEVRAANGTISFNAALQLNQGGRFTGAGNCRVIGGSVGLAGVTTVADTTLELADGQFQGAGDDSGAFATAGAGRLIWSGGTLLPGTLALATNAQAEISGPAAKTFADGAVLENRGALLWRSGTILANGYSGPSFIRNRAGAVFTIAGTDAAARINGSYVGQFENQPGAVLVLNTPGESPWTGWQLINDGVVTGVGGALRLDFGGASSGLFTNGAGAELRFTGGTFALHDGTRFLGPGTARVAGATLTADGDATAGASDSPGLFILDSGTVNGTGFTSLGLFRWTGGDIGGTFSNAPAAVFTVAGAAPTVLDDGVIFNNAGVAQMASGSVVANGYSAASTWNNLAGGQFDIATDGSVFGRRNGSYLTVFNNSFGARLAKTAGTNSVLDTCVLNNSGELRSDSGTLAFNTTASLNPGGVFTGAGRHELIGGSVFWNGASAVQATTLNLSGATVTGGANATIVTSAGGLFDWTGGVLAGTMNLPAGSTLQLSGAGSKVLADGAVFNNSGAALFVGTGRLTANGYSADSLWNNLAGGHFDLSSEGGVFGRINGSHTTIFNNSPGARLAKTAGTNSVVDTCLFNNSGELRSDSGALTFNTTLNLNGGVFTGAGQHALAGGAVFWNGTNAVQGTTLNLIAATVVGATNATMVTADSGLLNWTGGVLDGTLNLPAGSTLQLSGVGSKVLADGAVFNNSGAALFVGTGRLTANGYSADSLWNNLPGGRFDISSDGGVFGRINGSHTTIFNNSPGARLAKTAGTNSVVDTCLLNNSGELRSDSGTLAFNAALNLNAGGGFTGAGRHEIAGGNVTLNQTTTVQGTTLACSAGALLGAADATLATTAGGLFDWTGGTLSGTLNFAAGGSFRLSGPSSKTLLDGAVLNNAGSLALSGSGPLLANGYNGTSTVSNLASGVILVSSNATWSRINGSYWGTFINGGAVRLDSAPRVFQSDWSYTQTASGSLSVLLAGTAPGTGYSQFTVNHATLNGRLNIGLGSGFAPDQTNTFDVLTYAASAGQFASLTVPALPFGRTLTPTYGATALTLGVRQATLVSKPEATAGGAFEFDLAGPASSGVIIQVSTNLVNWTSILTNSPFDGGFHFSEPRVVSPRGRFYRVLQQP